jgi:uncharacterized membrane protein YgcG
MTETFREHSGNIQGTFREHSGFAEPGSPDQIKYFSLPHTFSPEGASRSETAHSPTHTPRLLLLSLCASSHLSSSIYAEHYTARACPRVIGGITYTSLQELPHTICGPVVLLLVAFYDPRLHTGMGILSPPYRGWNPGQSSYHHHHKSYDRSRSGSAGSGYESRSAGSGSGSGFAGSGSRSGSAGSRYVP